MIKATFFDSRCVITIPEIILMHDGDEHEYRPAVVMEIGYKPNPNFEYEELRYVPRETSLCGESLEAFWNSPVPVGLKRTSLYPEECPTVMEQKDFTRRILLGMDRRICFSRRTALASDSPNHTIIYQNGKFGPEELHTNPKTESFTEEYIPYAGYPAKGAKKYDPRYWSNQGRWMSSESEYLAREGHIH